MKGATGEKIDALLKQTKRQFMTEAPCPPSLVGEALGREIARETMRSSGSDKVLSILCQEGIHPSIHQAFFREVSTSLRENRWCDCHWLSQWLLHMEDIVRERGRSKNALLVNDCLLQCIRAYSTYLVFSKETSRVMETYCRLQLQSSRIALVRETLHQLADGHMHRTITILSPILAVVLFGRPSSTVEISLFLQNFWRALWSACSTPTTLPDDIRSVLTWMTKALNHFLHCRPPRGGAGAGVEKAENGFEEIAYHELAQSWLVDLVLVAQTTCESHVEKTSLWLDSLLRETLPLFIASAPHTMFASEAVLQTILDLVDTMQYGRGPLDPLLVMRLCFLMMAAPTTERHAMLKIIAGICNPDRISVSCEVSIRLLYTLTSNFVQDHTSQTTAITLRRNLEVNIRDKRDSTRDEIQWDHGYILNSLLTSGSSKLIDKLCGSIDFLETNFSSSEQITALLLGISKYSDNEKLWRNYFGRLVSRYRHLGSMLLPHILDELNRTAISSASQEFLANLDFMAEFLVLDPHCTLEVWNLFHTQWMQSRHPLPMRIAMIRLFPKLCESNKRLYSRVVDALSTCYADENPEIRLAVAATIADLARNDHIREVSDVIGWIQNFLTEDMDSSTHSLIVHYALLSLHHLVVAQELEFNLVIKVLNKKLCPISDIPRVLSLPYIVLESLVMLLGDGEEGNEDGDSGDEKESQELKSTVSPQVSLSVNALLEIGNGLGKSAHLQSGSSRKTIYHTRSNVFDALSRYSDEALGIDDEGILILTSQCEDSSKPSHIAALRYLEIRNLVVEGLQDLVVDEELAPNLPVVKFAGRLIAREERILGSSFWQKRGRSRVANFSSDTTSKVKATLAALPVVSQLEGLASSATPGAFSIAILLSSDGSQLKILRDHADAAIETSDTIFLMFAVKAFLHTIRKHLSLSVRDADDVLKEIRGWNDIFVSSDAMYLALASYCASVTEIHSVEGLDGIKPSVLTLMDEIVDAAQGHTFQNEDIGVVSMGLVCIGFLFLGDLARSTTVISMLEQSVRGYGGQQDFGPYFSLALIAQTAGKIIEMKMKCMTSNDAKDVVTRISTFLMEELISCYEDIGEVSMDLLACLKSGKAAPDLVLSVEALGSNSTSPLMTKHVAARYILLSASLCLPTLQCIDGDLLLATFRLIESFEWGGGKGIVLAAILHRFERGSLLPPKELESIWNEYSSVFDRRIDSKTADTYSDGLEDIFYTVSVKSGLATPYVVHRLLVGNKELFDDDGCALSLVASALSIISMPIFGMFMFTDEPRLCRSAQAADVGNVVRLVSEASNLGDRSKYSSMGTILLGLLTTVQSPQDDSTLDSEKDPFIVVGNSTNCPDRKTFIDFQKLPRPLFGSLADCLINILESCSKSELHNAISAGTMAVLESISLPQPFMKFFLERILKSSSCRHLPALRLLCAQIRGRRSALHDGRDFISMAMTIFKASPKKWCEYVLEVEAERFLVWQMPDIIPKFSPDSCKECITNLWEICRQSKNCFPLSVVFLTSVRLLMKSAALSPKAISILREFVQYKLAADLSTQPLDALSDRAVHDTSLIDSYVSCAREIPVSTLDQSEFFVVEKAGSDDYTIETFRSLVIVKMIKLDALLSPQRNQFVLNSITSWMARNFPSASAARERDSFRRLFLNYAAASSNESSSSKGDRLSILVDILLLTTRETSESGLELLSVVLAHWCRGYAQSFSFCKLLLASAETTEALPMLELQQFCQVAIEELPNNLAVFAEETKCATIVANHLRRLQTHWLECQSAPLMLRITSQAILRCWTPPNDSSMSHTKSFLLSCA